MAEPAGETVRGERRGPVATLLIDNAAKRNALDNTMWAPMQARLASWERDDSVRVVVIKGAGDRDFSSGGNLAMTGPLLQPGETRPGFANTLAMLARFAKPVIAEVRGYCLGGGVALAMMADLRIAASDAVFGIPAAKLGRSYDHAMIARLVSLVGHAQARRLLLVGDRIDAAEALRIGLVEQIASPERLGETVATIADTIAANAPLSLHGMKRMIDEVLDHPGAPESEAARHAVAACLASADVEEGRLAFLERRAPRFSGR